MYVRHGIHTDFRGNVALQSNEERARCKSKLENIKISRSRAQSKEEEIINISIMLLLAKRKKKPPPQHTPPSEALGTRQLDITAPQL